MASLTAVEPVPRGRALAARRAIRLARGELALLPVLALAGGLLFWNLGGAGFVNLYYAAGVRSMLDSWHNLFFVAFDPAGFLALDKPPLAFWLQAGSAKLFGFNPLSLLLPEALAGLVSVALLYVLVRRSHGRPAGLVAALALAVSPISVATARNATPDAVVALLLLLAAWALLAAAESGRLRLLLLSAALVGLAFNTKMLEAYLVLPPFYLVYALVPVRSWRVRALQLGGVTAVLLAVSFSWALAVQLTPAHARPYVGGTSDNSELSLAFGWNGLDRLLGGRELTTDRGTPPEALGLEQAPGIGKPSPLRLVNRLLGGQIAWLLPLTILGLIVAYPRPWRRPRTRAQQAVLLWGAWLITGAAYFSVGGRFFAYYLVVLAPAVAAGAGIGLVGLWRLYRSGARLGWLLPVALALTAALQAHILADFPTWNRWLTPLILAVCVPIVLLLAGARRWPRLRGRGRLLAACCGAGFLALLVAPFFWGVIPVRNGGTVYAVAGPDSHHGDWFAPVQATDTFYFEAARTVVAALPDDHDRFFTAGIWPESAAPLILLTGRPSLAFGGFEGTDPILTVAQLEAMTRAGTVHEFLIGRETTQLDLINWITRTCRRGRLTGLGLLFRCG